MNKIIHRGGAESETAVQRYNRLKCEASELWEEVNGMKTEAAAAAAGSNKNSAAASGDIHSVGAEDDLAIALTILLCVPHDYTGWFIRSDLGLVILFHLLPNSARAAGNGRIGLAAKQHE